MKRNLISVILLLSLSINARPQDEVLLTVGGIPVYRSEFERIYHKNNQVSAFESKSVEDYLDLFINFKIKVMEARSLGYDTMQTFVRELAGYRDQLAKPYLQNRKIIEKQLQEAYDHTVTEVNASHIMVKIPQNPAPSDTLNAYNRIMDLRKRILSGESFEKTAREESEDPSAKRNSGSLGWFSAFMMVFPFENAAYNTPVGELSMPVKSRYGYHLIKVNGKRPALGEIRLAHIMTRVARTESQEKIGQARDKIFKYKEMLDNKVPFAEVAQKYSEDEGSARNGGQLRWLKSGELPADIEEQVFSLNDSGDFTIPLQSDFGWHIFQIRGKRPVASFDQLKSQLEERLMHDERGKLAEQSKIADIMKEADFVRYPGNIDDVTRVLDSTIYTGTWNPEAAVNLIEPVFAVNGREYLQKDLAGYVAQTRRYRKEEPIELIVHNKCEEYINRELLAFENRRLEEKYPEFKNLMEEYHDGILLFNITDNQVWSRAVKDSAGLVTFFGQHQGDYNWKERADVSVYMIKDESKLSLVTKLAKSRSSKKWTADEFIKKICPLDSVPCITITDGLYEKGDTAVTGQFRWKKGSIAVSTKNSVRKVVVVNDLLQPMPKAFQEIRGQVTADYQNYLDQKWISTLRAKYPVIIDKQVLQRVR